jgi:hypothetical protein
VSPVGYDAPVPRLGDILIARGATTQAQLRAAIENQVIFGGRLGTNLLELGAVTEEALADALSQFHGVPVVHGDMALEPKVLALLRPELVDRLEVIPRRLDGKRLEVLVADPRDLAKLDEVAFATGKQVRPVVVPEARLWALLQRHYGIERQLRGIVLGEDAVARVRAPSRTPVPAALESSADLMGEEEFTALYAAENMLDRRRADAPRAPPVPVRAPVPTLAAAPEPPTDGLALPGVLAGEWTGPLPAPRRGPAVLPPPVAPGSPPLPARALGGAMVSNDEILAALQGEATAQRPPPPATIPVHPPEPPEPPPLSFADAVAALAGVADRNAIARTVLRFARARFRRAVLLAIHGDVAEGWEGVGEGVSPQVVARLKLRVSQDGILGTVVRSRAHFLGPLVRCEQNIQLLRALGRGAPRNALALPVLARGRVVNVLYADAGRGELVDGSAVGELLILAAKIAQSYEALLARAR